MNKNSTDDVKSGALDWDDEIEIRPNKKTKGKSLDWNFEIDLDNQLTTDEIAEKLRQISCLDLASKYGIELKDEGDGRYFCKSFTHGGADNPRGLTVFANTNTWSCWTDGTTGDSISMYAYLNDLDNKSGFLAMAKEYGLIDSTSVNFNPGTARKSADQLSKAEKKDEEQSYRFDFELIPKHYIIPKQIDFSKDMSRYIKSVFASGDNVCITTSPQSVGITHNAFDICKRLDDELTVESVVGNYGDGGVFVCINPTDGNGRKDANIIDYRHTLIESDKLSLDDQLSYIYSLRLPVSALVYSGNKSIHAVVKVNAKSKEEYTERVKFIQKVCNDNGFIVDTTTKNPSRLTRLPGVLRQEKGNVQAFIPFDQDDFCSSFKEWEDYIFRKIGVFDDGLPPFDDMFEMFDNPPQLAPILIKDLLRKGHQMLVSAQSKMGKSWSMIELAVAVATGTKWLDTFECVQGKVLYINLEIDRASFINRVIKVANALEIENKRDLANIQSWNLRGKAEGMSTLKDKIINRCKDNDYSLIIIDPIYKIMEGEENAANDVAKFWNYIEQITVDTGASVVVTHHHSKGMQGNKSAIDRASGSGSFARAPDCLMDFIRLDPESVRIELEENETAWRIEVTGREFAPLPNKEIVFSYPIHKPMSGLEFASVWDSGKVNKENNNNAINDANEKLLLESFDFLNKDGTNEVVQSDLIEYITTNSSVGVTTVKDWISKSSTIYKTSKKYKNSPILARKDRV